MAAQDMTPADRVAARFVATKTPAIVLAILAPILKGSLRGEVLKACERYEWDEGLNGFRRDVTEGDFDPLAKVSFSQLGRLFAQEVQFGQYSIDEDTVDLNVEATMLEVQFDVWGEDADDDNPDDRANFDHSIDDAVWRRFGMSTASSHTFAKNSWGGSSFVHRFTFKAPFDLASLLVSHLGAALEKMAAK